MVKINPTFCRHCDIEVTPFNTETVVIGSNAPAKVVEGWIHVSGEFPVDHPAEPPPEGILRIWNERKT